MLVHDDADAEQLVRVLQTRGATVHDAVIDLLFASSGIEEEVPAICPRPL